MLALPLSFIPHIEVFSLELPILLILWSFLRLAMNGCWVQISSGAAHSDLVSMNISLDPDRV